MNNTVWIWSYRKRYYFLRPWKWFRELFINIRNANMRMKKGYCYPDIWNFDNWFTSIAPEMLRYMADKGDAYPGQEPFETPEKWHKWLHGMANRLEECGRDYFDILEEKNEYSKQLEEIMPKAYERWKEKHPDEKLTHGQEFTPEEEEIRKKYWVREREIYDEHEKFVQDTFTELGKHWHCIWD